MSNEQAEAPPGPLFSKFRDVIQSGNAMSSDIAFYFVHWLTDLAGAEPFPLEGCEKFVLKFPPPILTSFLDSFPVVRKLDIKTETEVFEEYLSWRWKVCGCLNVCVDILACHESCRDRAEYAVRSMQRAAARSTP